MSMTNPIQDEIQKLRMLIAAHKGNIIELEEKLVLLCKQNESHKSMMENETKKFLLQE